MQVSAASVCVLAIQAGDPAQGHSQSGDHAVTATCVLWESAPLLPLSRKSEAFGIVIVEPQTGEVGQCSMSSRVKGQLSPR